MKWLKWLTGMVNMACGGRGILGRLRCSTLGSRWRLTSGCLIFCNIAPLDAPGSELQRAQRRQPVSLPTNPTVVSTESPMMAAPAPAHRPKTRCRTLLRIRPSFVEKVQLLFACYVGLQEHTNTSTIQKSRTVSSDETSASELSAKKCAKLR